MPDLESGISRGYSRGMDVPLNFRRFRSVGWGLIVAWMGICGMSADAPAADGPSGERIRQAAVAFLGALDAGQRRLAVFPVDDPERRDWSNLPHTIHPRKGIRLGDLTAAQKVLAHRLLQAGLSSQGYLKTAGIMQLDEVLLHLSGQDRAERPMFGLAWYWLSFLGEPSETDAWGWQLDGHHLALNFSLRGAGVAMTPTFMGSDPHEVRDGLHAGWRVLGAEDDTGVALMRALRPDQRRTAQLPGDTPGDVVAGPGRDKALTEPVGLAFSEMDAAQQALLRTLVEEYVHNYRHDLAHAQLDRIAAAGWDAVRFAWSGPLDGSAPYYYRVHGPALLIEFDNNRPPGRPDGPINHIHSVFRDPDRDYGADLLRRHLEESHGRKSP